MAPNFLDEDEKSTSKSFKERKPLINRKEAVRAIKIEFPTKIPVIIERYYKEKNLPVFGKVKFLIPQELTMSHVVFLIRSKMQIRKTQCFYLMINNKSMANMTSLMGDIYKENKDEDGFLYLTYASQEMFGLKSKLAKTCLRKFNY